VRVKEEEGEGAQPSGLAQTVGLAQGLDANEPEKEKNRKQCQI
jgi:hypothetical protein